MGFTLVGPWNCTWKNTPFPPIGIVWGLHWSTHETAHVKTLSCHTLELHGSMLVGPWSCPCKPTILPLIGIACGSHGFAHVKPLFCQTLALHGLHIVGPWKLPMYNHCLATYWNYMGFTLVGSWNCPCKATVLPLAGIKWGTHWSAHETAYIIPLFPHTLVKQKFLLDMTIVLAQVMPMVGQLWARYKLCRGWPLNSQCFAHAGFWMASPCPSSPLWGPWVLASWAPE